MWLRDKAAGLAECVGPQSVEQMLEGFVRSRQIRLELSVGHGARIYPNSRQNATCVCEKVVNGESLTALTAPSYGPTAKQRGELL